MRLFIRLLPIVAAFVAAVLWMGNSFAEDPLVQSFGSGSVNFGELTVQSIGYGAADPTRPGPAARPMAIRAAQLDAQRRLLEILQGVYITSETTVRDFMLESDVIRSKVEGYLKGARQVGDVRYMSDGTVEITMEAALSGAILGTLLPPTGAKVGTLTPPPSPSTSYTGFVFDATEFDVQFALAPRVLDEDGEETYGPDWVDRDAASDYGIVAYETSYQGNPRVGSNPFVVKAQRVAGSNKCDLVILNMDAAVLTSCEENLMALDQCKVIFLIK